MSTELQSFAAGGMAIVLGASGGIGKSLQTALIASGRFVTVLGLSRQHDGFDLADETSIAAAASAAAAHGLPVRLIVVATGVLHSHEMQPEKSWRHLNADQLARSFAVNAIGPALVAKHFLPLLPREGKAVFAAISAKVGSIGDNQLGGWYGYRASKAALNQLIHTASIELRRSRADAICVTLHPGTVTTSLSAPFAGGHAAVPSDFAAERMLKVIDGLSAADSGLMLDHTGLALPW